MGSLLRPDPERDMIGTPDAPATGEPEERTPFEFVERPRGEPEVYISRPHLGRDPAESPSESCLVRGGEVGRAVCIVIAGALEVVSVEGDASGARVIPVPTGSVIGEVGFFDARPRSATVRAVTDGEVRRLDHEGYEALAGSDPALARTLLFELGRILAVRLRQTNDFIRGWLG